MTTFLKTCVESLFDMTFMLLGFYVGYIIFIGSSV